MDAVTYHPDSPVNVFSSLAVPLHLITVPSAQDWTVYISKLKKKEELQLCLQMLTLIRPQQKPFANSLSQSLHLLRRNKHIKLTFVIRVGGTYL